MDFLLKDFSLNSQQNKLCKELKNILILEEKLLKLIDLLEWLGKKVTFLY